MFGLNEASFASSRDLTLVGGVALTDYSQAPYAVSFHDKTGAFVCGGSLISDHWVLTAGHCLGHFTHATVGSLQNEGDPAAQIFSTQDFINPKYEILDWGGAHFDFGLVKLDHDVNLKDTGVQPIRLADPDFEKAGKAPVGSLVSIFAWGLPGSGAESASLILESISIPILSNLDADRSEILSGKIEDNMLIAGDLTGKRAICYGDSGSPLVAIEPMSGERVQVGVASFGSSACGGGYDVYARVSTAYVWIQSIIK